MIRAWKLGGFPSLFGVGFAFVLLLPYLFNHWRLVISSRRHTG